MTEFKVDKETAQIEFARFADFARLKTNLEDEPEESKSSFLENKETMVFAIQTGFLIISEIGQPTYTPEASENKNPIVFNKPKGATLAAMNKSNDMLNLFAAMATLTRTGSARFSDMELNPDLRVCMAVTNLFLE